MSTGTRRDFLRRAGAAASLLSLAGLPGCSRQEPGEGAGVPSPDPEATAATAPPLPPASGQGRFPLTVGEGPLAEDEPVATALGYRRSAATVDSARFPRWAEGQGCGDCVWYRGRSGEAEGPCQLFSGRLVSAAGWCQGYGPRA